MSHKNEKIEKPNEKFTFTKLLNGDSKFFKRLQFLGQAMLFPLLSIPIAAVFYRFGVLFTAGMGDSWKIEEYSAIWYIGTILKQFGQPVFSQLPIIFGIGLAFGLTKDRRGEAAIAGGIAAWVLMSMLGENGIASLIYSSVLPFNDGTIDGYSQFLYMPRADYSTGEVVWTAAYNLEVGVLGGILAGWITARCYNKWKNIHMPAAFSMFEGMRFIPLISTFMMVPLAIILAIVWPPIQYVLMLLSKEVAYAGTGGNPGAAYAVTSFLKFFTDLLCLTGLENVVGTFISYQMPIQGPLLSDPTGTQVVINGDVNAFNQGVIGSGMFGTGGFFACIAGYWGIAMAIVTCAPKEIKKQVSQIVWPTCLFCSLTGMGQTLMFPLWYASPLLWITTSVMDGLFAGIPVAMGIRTTATFASGWIDWILAVPTSWQMSIGLNAYNGSSLILTNPLWMLAITAGAIPMFWVVFTFLIKKNKIETSFTLNAQEMINEMNAKKETKKLIKTEKQMQKEADNISTKEV